jgi:hypothetical protein
VFFVVSSSADTATTPILSPKTEALATHAIIAWLLPEHKGCSKSKPVELKQKRNLTRQ